MRVSYMCVCMKALAQQFSFILHTSVLINPVDSNSVLLALFGYGLS